MTVTAIQIGLHPDAVDFESADFSQFKGLSKEGLTKANSDNVAGLRAAGYEVDNCLIATGAAGAEKARTWLSTKRYDAVLIGAGVRLVASNTLLFEAIVNAAHAATPAADSCSTTRRRRHPMTSAGGIPVRPTRHRRSDREYPAQGGCRRRRCRTGRVDRGGRPGQVRPLGGGARTVARDQPVEPRVRDDGQNPRGPRRPRPCRRRSRARAQGVRRFDLRGRANRSDASAIGIPVRRGHPADECRQGARRVRRDAGRRHSPRLRSRCTRTGFRRRDGHRRPKDDDDPQHTRTWRAAYVDRRRRRAQHRARISSARTSRERPSCPRWCWPT